MLKIVETPYCSLLQGELADGCKACVKGEKLVIFVTGMCPASCFFCPISAEKKMRDVSFANEQELSGTEDEQIRQLIAEAKANKATGAGITGGDPLARLSRTCAYIKALKKEFGLGFHIHLYTPLILVNESTLKRLAAAGLDEIRFHPSLQSRKFWPKMLLAKQHRWKTGIEIPVLPDKAQEIKQLIDYAAEHDIISFLNLNELEISDSTIEEFESRGYRLTGRDSYAVAGSRETALELMTYCQQHHLNAHFCTTTLKDRIQMGNRIIRRAENVAQPFDLVDEEGLLTRGAIYISYPPEFSYGKKIKALSAEERTGEERRLLRIFRWLIEEGMPPDAGIVDMERLRICLSAAALEELVQYLKEDFPDCKPMIITEYPTADIFIVEMDAL